MTLPVPEHVAKSIAVYVSKVRPKSKYRTLFLTLCTPHRPISKNVVGYCIKKCMRQADLPSTLYWLRHTYAQNLIESGTPIFEIKEMMGHDKIESAKNYLHIHIKMMRKVLSMKNFESFLAGKLEEYVAYRKNLGYAKKALRHGLNDFDRYLKEKKAGWDQ